VPGELIVLNEAPAVSPDPRFSISAHDFKLSRLLYAPLVSVENDKLEPKMELAESVVTTDGLHFVITLREARFGDGRPVTADDVAWTLASMRDPATGSRLRQRFIDDGLDTVEVVDARHLKMSLKHSHAPFITDLDIGILPKGTARGALPPGAGAFIVESRDADTWKLRRNPYFYGGLPPAEHLTIKSIGDDNARLLALVGGSADLTQNTISPLILDQVAAHPRLRVETARSSVYTYLGFNNEDPILKDARVRRAIAHAIDRERIVRTKLGGRGVLATGMLPTFHWAYEAVDVPTFDPAEARRLLDDAGYPKPADGPRFSLVYKTSNNRFRVAVAQVIAAMLADVGIDVDVRVLEFATFFADLKKGNFQMFTMQMTEIAEPDLYTNFFDSSRIPRRENLDAGGNRMRYRSVEIDKLLEEGRRETVLEKRREIYGKVQRVLARDLPVVSLWHEDNVVAMRKEVSGYKLTPTGQWSALARTSVR
jgi:peptide/nickel transport system substrate-binding protein